MHLVLNSVRLSSPIGDEVFDAAQRELPVRAAEIEGLRAFHVVRVGDDEMIVVIVGENEAAIERMRSEVGNAWMRENVIPHAEGPPDRKVGVAAVSFERG